MSPASRKRLYREGKRLLGPDRMARLNAGSRKGVVHVKKIVNRSSALGARLRPAPWITVSVVQVVDSQNLLLCGRIDPGADGLDCQAPEGARVVLVLADGSQLEVSAALHLYRDRKAIRTGSSARAFAALCHLPTGSRPLHLTLTLAGCEKSRSRCPEPLAQASVLDRMISTLSPLGDCADGARALLDQVLGPAAERVWREGELNATSPAIPEDRAARYNEELAPDQPRTTIIVPIYGRHDFIAHQLTHFVQDDEIRASELIYVIDDPRLKADVERQASELACVHDMAFTVLYLGRNRGYAGANNAGARIARGTELLLLNSDVFPRRAGWLGAMRASVDGATDDYVIGARLLYDDHSVQHDGIRFEPGHNFEGLWQNRHPGKGLPQEVFHDSSKALPRDAVTGACLLVSRERFTQFGGLDEGYVLGNFEDSDFCLKARRAGLRVAVATQAVLYHLEGQSQSMVTRDGWKRHITHLNCWRHHQRWHDDIAALAAQRGGQR